MCRCAWLFECVGRCVWETCQAPLFGTAWLRTFRPLHGVQMAIVDGRLTLAAGSITFECRSGECTVCGEAIRGRAAAAVDRENGRAFCALAADPIHGEQLCCHVMHAYCADGTVGCPGCAGAAAAEAPSIRRMGFDVGGVIVRHREDLEVDSAGLTGEDYLHTQATEGALETLAAVVLRLGSENVYIISKCGAETEARTLEWMDHSGFFEKTGIRRGHVHFCRDVKEKAPLVAKLKLDAFVDDRLDVLRPMLSVASVRPMLFMPRQEVVGQSPAFWIPRLEKLEGWESVRALVS